MSLPSEFAALEPYLDWDLATEPERYAKRLASTMAEMQEFYDVAFPLLNDVIAYCDKYPLGRPARGREDSDAHHAVARHGVLPDRGMETAARPRQRRSVGRSAPGTGDLERC